MLETQVATQAVVALSSGEAEFYALGRAAASVIMMRQVFEQCGFVGVVGVVQSDSSAARGIASRIGSGKLRHLHIRDLWIQEKTRSGEIKLECARSEDNTSDLGTKYLDRKRIDKLIGLAGLMFETVGPAGARGLAVTTISILPSAAAGAAPADTDMKSKDEVIFWMFVVLAIVGLVTVFVKAYAVVRFVVGACFCRRAGRRGGVEARPRDAACIVRAAGQAAYRTR